MQLRLPVTAVLGQLRAVETALQSVGGEGASMTATVFVGTSVDGFIQCVFDLEPRIRDVVNSFFRILAQAALEQPPKSLRRSPPQKTQLDHLRTTETHLTNPHLVAQLLFLRLERLHDRLEAGVVA